MKVFVACHNKAWCDSNIFLDWYSRVFLYYEKYIIKKKCLLILDKSPSHCNNRIIEDFKKNDTEFIFIPGGLARYLQPLDIEINSQFKKGITEQYINAKIENINKKISKNKNDNEERKKLINIVYNVWMNNIKKETIQNGFFRAGISIKQDGSEDKKWINEFFPQKILDNYSIYDEFENNSE